MKQRNELLTKMVANYKTELKMEKELVKRLKEEVAWLKLKLKKAELVKVITLPLYS